MNVTFKVVNVSASAGAGASAREPVLAYNVIQTMLRAGLRLGEAVGFEVFSYSTPRFSFLSLKGTRLGRVIRICPTYFSSLQYPIGAQMFKNQALINFNQKSVYSMYCREYRKNCAQLYCFCFLYTSLVGVSLSNIYCEVCSVIYILVSDYRIMKLPHIQFVDLAATFDVCSPIVNEMLKYICMHCS